MKIYSRVGDKILYISLVIISVTFFLGACFIFAWQYSLSVEYWEVATMCRATQDFQCLWDLRSNQAIAKDIGWNLLATLLIVYGLLLCAMTQILFKGFKRS